MLKLCNISKRYGNIEVLKKINLEIKPGEIHGLVGENGAGKSTLLNILFGMSDIGNSGGYKGDIFLEGKKVAIQNSNQAVKLGIGMVHQEFALIPYLTVRENILMGREKVFPLSKKFLGESLAYIDKEKNRKKTVNILQRLNIKLDSELKILDLSVNLKHFVEFAREISKESLKVLLLDEPTSALCREDTEKLLKVLHNNDLKDTAIILISHRLEEIVSICHKVSVLRNGEIVDSFNLSNFKSNQLKTSVIKHIARSMIGHTINKIQRNKRKKLQDKEDPVIMTFKDFSVHMPGEMISSINFNIYLGEIVGIAGLSGHGKLALGNGMFGIYPYSGHVIFDNQQLDITNTAEVLAKGIYLLPDDRRNSGLLLDRSIMENIIFTPVQIKNEFLAPFFYNNLSFIDRKKSSDYTKQCIKKFDIRCHNIKQKVNSLSGGNQQKVCLARAITMHPKILFVNEPTRGIDIAAKEIILQILLDINQNLGTTVIIASSELDELKRVCDRIVVMHEGKIFNIFSPETDDIEIILAFSGEMLTESEKV
jgi:simple sugar transport system ATP-binding protein